MSTESPKGDVILLLGPTGCGKSSFIRLFGVKNVGVGDTPRPYTQKCEGYPVVSGGRNFVLIDTPGFEDIPSLNLRVLNEIGTFLHKARLDICGAIYFHRITDGRLTGSSRSNIEIFKNICGKEFFPRVAFATTMWDLIDDKKRDKYEALRSDLQERHMTLTPRSPRVFKLNNDSRTAEDLLSFFATCENKRPPELQLVRELKRLGPRSVRKTAAGKEVLRQSGGGWGCTIL